jgi:hypothetical protein
MTLPSLRYGVLRLHANLRGVRNHYHSSRRFSPEKRFLCAPNRAAARTPAVQDRTSDTAWQQAMHPESAGS